jgi:hypothetical protein
MNTERFHKKILQAGCVFLGAVLLLFCFLPAAQAKTDADALQSVIEAAFSARRAHTANGKKLLSDAAFLESCCGAGLGDWAAFAMARYGVRTADGETQYGYDEDYAVYADALERKLNAFYAGAGITASVKLTEYYRMAIALAALGRDAGDIVLAATLNNPVSLKRLSVITTAYALLAMAAQNVSVPEAPAHTPAEFIQRLFELQHDDGGWSLTPALNAASDVDVTCMALTALAPCMLSGNKTYTRKIGDALDFLSRSQSAAGDFGSYGVKNAESTAQVLTALTALGADPLTDERFVKNGHTVVDGLLLYRLKDGSFTHTYTKDPENDAYVPGGYNYLATDQAAYALVSLWRRQNGLNALYNMTPDVPETAPGFYARIAASLRALLERLFAMLRALKAML